MQKWIWSLGMWLLGIGWLVVPVQAFDLASPETLNYQVYWGFMRMGDAKLEYVPNGKNYTLRATVKDDSSLIELHDVWESQGVHEDNRPFVPRVYRAVQAENSYRADKMMTFDAAKSKIVYTNNRNPTNTVPDLVMNGARDLLATVYAMRLDGASAVQRMERVEAVSMKEFVTLQRDKGVKTTLKIGNREMNVWQVRMRTVTNGKPDKESWTIYLRDDATLVPVQIIAATKFGTFRASMKF